MKRNETTERYKQHKTTAALILFETVVAIMMKKCGVEPLVVCVGIVHVGGNMWHRRVTSAVAAADGRQPDKK
jgi:hypothetical protein